MSRKLSSYLCLVKSGCGRIVDVNIGYARVSTGDQNLDLQRDALMTAGCEESKMFTDTLSRVKDGRSGFVQALEKVIHSQQVSVTYGVPSPARSVVMRTGVTARKKAWR